MPIPNAAPAVVLPAGWVKRPFWEAWTRGRVEKWNMNWGVRLDGREYAVTRPRNTIPVPDLTFPTPLAAMMWVELEISNAS